MLLRYLVHSNKSSGIIKYEKENEGLFLFHGTTTEGSSGSPILNSDGDAYAISFGNYSDIECKAEGTDDDLETFDVEIKENESNFIMEKNVNLAIKLNHPNFTEYFSFNTCNNSYLNSSSVLNFNNIPESEDNFININQQSQLSNLNFSQISEAGKDDKFTSMKRKRDEDN